MTNHKISIGIHDLSIGYRKGKNGVKVIAANLNAEAAPGTLTCLIGKNGTGKSTLLRTMARLQPQLHGQIAIGGKGIEYLADNDCAKLMSIVLTQRPTADNITAKEIVALGRAPYTGYWGRLSATDNEIVGSVISRIGIDNIASQPAHSLSDGEMQKVMIAKSVAQDTPVILLDEPTAFLDFPTKIDILLMLRQLAHTYGKTIVLSTHDIESALQTADAVWLLDEDGMVCGSPHDIAANGLLKRYIGREDIAIDPETMNIHIKKLI